MEISFLLLKLLTLLPAFAALYLCRHDFMGRGGRNWSRLGAVLPAGLVLTGILEDFLGVGALWVGRVPRTPLAGLPLAIAFGAFIVLVCWLVARWLGPKLDARLAGAGGERPPS